MDISGISNITMPVINPAGDCGSADFSPVAPTGIAAAALGRMEQLVQLIQGFSSAEVLTALLMSHGPVHQRPHGVHEGPATLAVLGLPQATQVAGLPPAGSFTALPVMGAAVVGAQISVQG
jgi:hypothetical protein